PSAATACCSSSGTAMAACTWGSSCGGEGAARACRARPPQHASSRASSIRSMAMWPRPRSRAPRFPSMGPVCAAGGSRQVQGWASSCRIPADDGSGCDGAPHNVWCATILFQSMAYGYTVAMTSTTTAPASEKPERKGRLSAEDWAQAALDLIAEHGVASVAVEPLARRLGVTKGSFYWHFPSRDALLQAAL